MCVCARVNACKCATCKTHLAASGAPPPKKKKAGNVDLPAAGFLALCAECRLEHSAPSPPSPGTREPVTAQLGRPWRCHRTRGAQHLGPQNLLELRKRAREAPIAFPGATSPVRPGAAQAIGLAIAPPQNLPPAPPPDYSPAPRSPARPRTRSAEAQPRCPAC